MNEVSQVLNLKIHKSYGNKFNEYEGKESASSVIYAILELLQ